jgi:hypothetical protein
VQGASIPEAAEIAWLIPKDHVLVNRALTPGRGSFANDTDSRRCSEYTGYPFQLLELENWRKDATVHSIQAFS